MQPIARFSDADLTTAVGDFLAHHTVTTGPASQGTEWSDDELDLAAQVYKTMLDTKPLHLNKAKHYLDLAVVIDRSVDAVERRMMNISAVLKKHGQPIVHGLNPSGTSGQNVGGNVEPRLIAMLEKNGLFGSEAQQRHELHAHWATASQPASTSSPSPR